SNFSTLNCCACPTTGTATFVVKRTANTVSKRFVIWPLLWVTGTAVRTHQKMIFRPNCIAREPPDPRTGFELVTSGVSGRKPKLPWPALAEGSVNELSPPGPPNGFEMLGWLSTLKNSARNCAVTLSFNFVAFVMDRSQL